MDTADIMAMADTMDTADIMDTMEYTPGRDGGEHTRIIHITRTSTISSLLSLYNRSLTCTCNNLPNKRKNLITGTSVQIRRDIIPT
jgi:hypothetical protein